MNPSSHQLFLEFLHLLFYLLFFVLYSLITGISKSGRFNSSITFCDLSSWIFLYELLIHKTAKIKPKTITVIQRIIFLTCFGCFRSLSKKFKILIYYGSNIIIFASSAEMSFFLIDNLGKDSGFFMPRFFKNLSISSNFIFNFGIL